MCEERRGKGEGRMRGWEEARDIDEEGSKKKRLGKGRDGLGEVGRGKKARMGRGEGL
jgi:hypothetical protein